MLSRGSFEPLGSAIAYERDFGQATARCIAFMRNPFIRGGAVPTDRLAFIVATKGGSAWLLAGALFWAGAGISGLLASPGVWTKVYLYGGFSVPIVGWLFAKAQSVTVPPKSALVLLVAIAATITPFCFPLLILIEQRDPALLPVALTVIDGAHLLVLMWLQLDYAYFLAAVAKGIIGATFGFVFLEQSAVGVGFASAAVSLLAGWSVYRDARNAVQLYAPNYPTASEISSGAA